jgi:hypothetical protein
VIQWGVTAHDLGASMQSKILPIGLALIPAAILICAHSSLGEAKGDECKAKPDGVSPAGFHWYYRVDRANNRHCWYLQAQGMPVHSRVDTASRSLDVQSDAAGEQVVKTLPIIRTPQPQYEQSETTADEPVGDFADRWVDMPKSVDLNARADLNAHAYVAESGYAAEHAMDNKQEQLPPTLANASAANGEVRQNAGSSTNFGSISLAGAVVLALLLISEALVRFVRASAWSLLRFNRRAASRRRTEHSEPFVDAAPLGLIEPMATEVEPITRTQTGVNELRRLLQRAGAGLTPPQSFAPSGSVQHHEQANSAPAHSTVARVKSRSFSGMTWAPF